MGDTACKKKVKEFGEVFGDLTILTLEQSHLQEMKQ